MHLVLSSIDISSNKRMNSDWQFLCNPLSDSYAERQMAERHDGFGYPSHVTEY